MLLQPFATMVRTVMIQMAVPFAGLGELGNVRRMGIGEWWAEGDAQVGSMADPQYLRAKRKKIGHQPARRTGTMRRSDREREAAAVL